MLEDKLNRLSRHFVKPEEKKDKELEHPERYIMLAEALDGELCAESNGTYLTIVSDFSDTYAHGRAMIMDLEILTPFRKRYFYRNADDTSLNARNLLFFDMETTGLGGSGTVPFLIGFGSVTEDGFQVRQYFLPDYSDEEAMLEAVRQEINENTILVSYNGKSFDYPILADRMILQRVERNLNYKDHIDLLHIARRLYKRRLGDCTLGNIEKKILDFYRIDDTPGYLVPSIYFNWLNTDETDELAGVVEHNLHDIVSLFFLMHHFAGVQKDPAGLITEPDDILSLARILEGCREHKDVCRLLESFDNITNAHERFDILYLQSMSYKRSGQIDQAASLWNIIAESDGREAFCSLIELAKLAEHRLKEPKNALEYSLRAQKICPNSPRLAADVQKRVNRLRRKLCD